MTPYPDTPSQPFPLPSGVVVVDGQGRLTIPTNGAGFECPLIPLANLPPPNSPLPVSPPYRLPGRQIAQASATWLTVCCETASWWGYINDPLSPSSIGEVREYEGQTRFWWVNRGSVLQSIPLAFDSVGWVYWPDYAGQVFTLVGNKYWDELGIIDWEQWNSDWVCTSREIDNKLYYEAAWAFFEIYNTSWAYCLSQDAPRRAPGLAPALLACALLGLPLTATADSIAAGSGRRPRRRPTQKSEGATR